MRGSIEAKISLGFLLAAVLIIVMGFGFYRGVQEFLASDGAVKHSQLVIEQAGEVFSTLKDAETFQRGFSMSGDDAYMVPYTKSVAHVPVAAANLLGSVSDNPKQAAYARELAQVAKARLAIAEQRIAERRQYGIGALTPRYLSHRGMELMDTARQLTQTIIDEEHTIPNERTAMRQRHFYAVLFAF